MTGRVSIDDVYPADRLTIREVGLRDGLQLVRSFPSTADKREWLALEHAAGVRHFEAGSFLPAAVAPQFADVVEVVDAVKDLPGGVSSALILNRRGAERALLGPADEIIAVVSASERHNLANIRRSREQSLAELREIVALRDAADRKPVVSVGISMSFGCSIEGDVPIGEVLRIAGECADAGVDLIYVADTVGYGGPAQVRELLRALRPVVGTVPIGAHFHDTRGLGLANAAAAMDEGVRILDASLGGLGGCPFAPNATGNIVLEDAVFLARSMGFDVPVDVDGLMRARRVLERTMPEERLQGAMARAGKPLGGLITGTG